MRSVECYGFGGPFAHARGSPLNAVVQSHDHRSTICHAYAVASLVPQVPQIEPPLRRTQCPGRDVQTAAMDSAAADGRQRMYAARAEQRLLLSARAPRQHAWTSLQWMYPATATVNAFSWLQGTCSERTQVGLCGSYVIWYWP